MSDKVVAELQEPTPAVGDGGPDMIQLLTPEGERLSHPDYDKYVADLTPEDLRSFYRDLRAQIDAIETVDVGSKASALEALDNLDRGFGAYERSLDFGISRPAVPKARKADKKADEAKKGIRVAIRALSQ